jgi:H+-transporting ATPase
LLQPCIWELLLNWASQFLENVPAGLLLTRFYRQAAAVLAAGLEDWVDFAVICALLLLNAAVGFIQEYQAGSIVDELKKTLALKAVVLREGRYYEVDAQEVVPGDILHIEEVIHLPLPPKLICCSQIM